MRFYKAWLYLCYNLNFHKSVFRKVTDTDAWTCRFWCKILTVNFVKRTEIGYVFKEAGCLNYAVKISSRLFQNRSDIFANSFGLTLNCIFFYVAVCRVYCYLPRSKEKSVNDFALWIRSYCGRCRWSVKCFIICFSSLIWLNDKSGVGQCLLYLSYMVKVFGFENNAKITAVNIGALGRTLMMNWNNIAALLCNDVGNAL